MQSASADFPIDGRAAMMIRFPGWKPDVIRSSSRKPDGVPGHVDAGLVERVIRSKLSFSSDSMSDEARS